MRPVGEGALRRLNVAYYSITAVQTVAIMLPLAVLILHMLERGVTLGIVGSVLALRSVLVVLIEVPSGALADAIGRKPVALLSQALTFASMVLLLFLGAPGGAATMGALLLLYALTQGVGSAMHSGALDAWYIDTLRRVAPRAPLSEQIARVEIVIGFASMVGVAGGAALPSTLARLDLPFPLSGYGAALAAGLALRALTFALTAWLVREPRTDPESRPGALRVLRDAGDLVRRPAIALLSAASFTTGFGLIAVETLWQPAAQTTLGFTPETSGVVALLGAAYGAALAIGPLLMLALVRRFPQRLALLAAFAKIGIGAGLLLLGAATGGIGIGVGLSLAYLALAGHGTPFETLFNERIPDERRSVMLSVANLTNFGGITLGSLVLGFAAESFGTGPTLIVAGALVVATAAFYLPLIGSGGSGGGADDARGRDVAGGTSPSEPASAHPEAGERDPSS